MAHWAHSRWCPTLQPPPWSVDKAAPLHRRERRKHLVATPDPGKQAQTHLGQNVAQETEKFHELFLAEGSWHTAQGNKLERGQ